MSQHAAKVWIRFQSSKKTGENGLSFSTKHQKQSPSQNQKRVLMSSLCIPCCMQLKLKKKTNRLTDMQVFWNWTCLRGLARTLQQVISQTLHSPTDKLTNKNLTAKQGALHKTLKICLCFILFVSFRLN